MKYHVNTKGMGCKHCIARVENAMEALGAEIVSMELNSFDIDFAGEPSAVKAAIEALGFEVVDIKAV